MHSVADCMACTTSAEQKAGFAATGLPSISSLAAQHLPATQQHAQASSGGLPTAIARSLSSKDALAGVGVPCNLPQTVAEAHSDPSNTMPARRNPHGSIDHQSKTPCPGVRRTSTNQEIRRFVLIRSLSVDLLVHLSTDELQ